MPSQPYMLPDNFTHIPPATSFEEQVTTALGLGFQSWVRFRSSGAIDRIIGTYGIRETSIQVRNYWLSWAQSPKCLSSPKGPRTQIMGL